MRPVVEKYERKGHGFNSSGPNQDECRELIIKLIEHYPMATIFIDALDECEPEKRQSLLDALESILQDSSLGLFKIFISSRDDQNIVCTLRNYSNIDIVSEKNTADIEAFVRTETNRLVQKRRLLRESPAQGELKNLIITQVSKDADGM